MQRIYGSKKGEIFTRLPTKVGKSILRVKVEYYVDREAIKSIEGKNLVWKSDGTWTFRYHKKTYTIKENKKGMLKMYKESDSKGIRIGGMFSIPTLRPKPKKKIVNKHRWEYEIERENWKYDYSNIDNLQSSDMSANDLPVMVIL